MRRDHFDTGSAEHQPGFRDVGGVLHVDGEPYRMAVIDKTNQMIGSKKKKEPVPRNIFHVPLENGIVLTGPLETHPRTPVPMPHSMDRGEIHAEIANPRRSLLRAIDTTTRKGVPFKGTINQRAGAMQVIHPHEFHGLVAQLSQLPSGSGTEEGWEKETFPWEKGRRES